MRISNAATPLHTAATPRARSSNRLQPELPSGNRHRSPSAERASGFGAKGPRKDNRLLTDKSYQNLMLNKIDQYFYEIQQTSLLNNNGSLKPLTLKMFVEATNCLVKLLDVKQDITMANYTDEVPKVAKKLHYPGTVTKSWLKTANTMHSWPQVLGWLSWLSEVCEAKDKAEVAFSIDKIPFLGNDDDESRRSTFKAMFNIYKAWNDEKLDEEAALTEKRVRELNEEYGDVDKDIEEEELRVDKEKASINDQQEAEVLEKYNKLNKMLESLRCDESRDNEAINFIEESVRRVILEEKHIKDECERLEEEIEKDYVEHQEMIVIVDNQIMSVEKRDEIMKQFTEIQNCIHQYDNHIKDIENGLYALDLRFASCNQNLYKAILAYNKDIIMHLECDTGTDLEALELPDTNLRRRDIMDIFKMKEAAMLSFQENIRKQFGQIKSAIDANSDELNSLQDKLETQRKDKSDYFAKADEQRLCIQQIQRQAKETEAKLKERINHLENDIIHLQGSTPDVEAAMNELVDAQDKLQAVCRRSDFVEKQMERFFDQLYRTLADHENKLYSVLEKLPKHGERAREA